MSALLIVDAPATTLKVTDLAAYAPADPTFTDAIFRVRASRTTGMWQDVPRAQWSVRDHIVTLPAGFSPGLAYEFSYTAANPPVAGLGFAAIRDTAAWLRNHPRADVASVTRQAATRWDHLLPQ